MLDEKKRIDIANWRIQGCLNQGGEVTFKNEDVSGIDKPVDIEALSFLNF